MAEEDRDLADLIGAFFESKGWSVVSLPRSADALVDIKHVSADAALIDVRSFSSNAFRLLEKLLTYAPRLPVIVIASFGDSVVASRARGMGVVHVLEKPFELEDLELSLRSIRR